MAGTNQIKISELPTKENPSTNDYLVMDDGSETSRIKAKDFINSFYPDFINSFYPVGSIYMSVNDIEPSVLFGGTWEKIKDRFLLASGDTYTNGNTGGEAQHTLTVSELPKNIGQFNALSWATHQADTKGAFTIEQVHADKTAPSGSNWGDANYSLSGGGNAHNNMPPYLVVNIWKRTA